MNLYGVKLIAYGSNHAFNAYGTRTVNSLGRIAVNLRRAVLYNDMRKSIARAVFSRPVSRGPVFLTVEEHKRRPTVLFCGHKLERNRSAGYFHEVGIVDNSRA